MYSILIKNGDKSWIYNTNDDGSVFKGDSTATKARVQELMATYPLGKITVVHNVNLTSELTIEDVA